MKEKTIDEKADLVKASFNRIKFELAKVMVGQEALIRNIYICLLCGGHALIEGVPGLGKTLLVKSLGKVINLKYSRIQFTPDLMPADILGTNIVNQDEKGTRFFEFYKGPIFGQIILADEINRATPKTQSALLEAMQEESVTIFGHRYELETPFMVLATQNPLEMEGTYPLPEAQVDRFFFKLKVDFPTAEQISEIMDKTTEDYRPTLNQSVDGQALREMKPIVREVPIAAHVKDYAVRLVLSSHPDKGTRIKAVQDFVRYGASPRGVQSLILGSKVAALLDGRFNVSLDDIRAIAKPSLRHRIILNLRGEAEGMDVDQVVDDLLAGVPEKTRI